MLILCLKIPVPWSADTSDSPVSTGLHLHVSRVSGRSLLMFAYVPLGIQSTVRHQSKSNTHGSVRGFLEKVQELFLVHPP